MVVVVVVMVVVVVDSGCSSVLAVCCMPVLVGSHETKESFIIMIFAGFRTCCQKLCFVCLMAALV